MLLFTSLLQIPAAGYEALLARQSDLRYLKLPPTLNRQYQFDGTAQQKHFP